MVEKGMHGKGLDTRGSMQQRMGGIWSVARRAPRVSQPRAVCPREPRSGWVFRPTFVSLNELLLPMLTHLLHCAPVQHSSSF